MKKKLGSSTSYVHGKEKEIICHDMRKYVWQKYDFLQNIKKKSARSSIGLERLTTDQEVRGSTPLGRAIDYQCVACIPDSGERIACQGVSV